MSLQLLYAAELGDVTRVQQLLHPSAQHLKIGVTQIDEYDNTFLILASFTGDTAVVKRILQDPNINVNYADIDGATPLIIASNNGNDGVVEILLNHPHIDVNHVDNDGDTPLLKASREGHTATVELLLQQPRIKVVKVDWTNVKVRMLYLLYDKTNSIVKTPKEVTWCHDIRSFVTPLKQSIVQHSELYKDLDKIIYEFARPSYVQSMEAMNLNS